ncbi:MAG: HEPN domain-containing protein [Oscillospiraceae bacterium]|nr:HEPN domain-containing protein [Oscillospiraceae bacterium]
MSERIQYWIEIAEYDFETAKAMLQTGRYLYVGFMCHQTIEKVLKAVIARDCADDEIPPKIHDLIKLAIRAKLFDKLSEKQEKFINSLNPLNIEARYPEYKDQLSKSLTADYCKALIKETEELSCWIKSQLSTQ